MNERFYQVGGSIRDKILDIPNKDVDYAVEAESFDAMRAAILARGGQIFLETPKFFTIRAHVPIIGATDFTLCRKEGEYTDGRHPDSVSIGTIYDDLARRDFTMNAIALDFETGQLIDPFNGQQDIKDGYIRCVGNPLERFTEDKLRIFRAMRFAITRKMKIHIDTSEAMDEISDFSGVSTERIREELFKMFEADTKQSILILTNGFPHLLNLVCERNLWFKPTMR